MPVLQHLWIIPLLPLLGAAANGLLGRRWSRAATNIVALGFTGLAFAATCELLREFAILGPAQVPWTRSYFTWILAGTFRADYALQVDQLTLVMLLVVTGVGWLIHLYSTGYMADDAGYRRFFTYLNLFMFFMLTLVLGANYLVLFVGWEGVGLCSYLLVGFWFLKKTATDAGNKAFWVNRVGDFGFLLGLFLMFRQFGSLDFGAVFGRAAGMPVETGGHGVITAMALLLLAGATGKSAQIPLYVWLPDAMEGPTPVSALIHAATMVAAGVYMVARSNVLFLHAPAAMKAVAVIGCLTAFFAATIALVQTDIKKVLAYSTISQLGYMFLGCGVGAFSAGIFHLMTHAFFKALLFLGAGSVMHALGGEQDMRKMGGLRKSIPWTFATMLAAALALSGAPGFSGFFSKDEILAGGTLGTVREYSAVRAGNRDGGLDRVLYFPADLSHVLRRAALRRARRARARVTLEYADPAYRAGRAFGGRRMVRRTDTGGRNKLFRQVLGARVQRRKNGASGGGGFRGRCLSWRTAGLAGARRPGGVFGGLVVLYSPARFAERRWPLR